MREMSLKDIQGVSLDILNEIHEFCQGNSIRYTLYYGTLLGAIRHNGFIPWDDDVDIAMPRPDYDRFINSYVSKKGYKLFSREINENENVYIPFSRVCEMEKTMVISPIIPWCSSLTGVWIDIFPLDGIDEDQTMAQNRINRVNKCRRQCFRVRRSMGNLIWRRGLKFNLKTILLKLTYKNKLYLFDRFISICQEKDYDCSKFFSTLVNPEYSEILPKSSCDKFLLNKFENTEFYVMNGFDLCLRSMYGNYMQLPPVEKRIPKQDYLNFYWR